ncbi:unnamed protein product [Linum trigynum]|uniref:Uncharacterized protein n=1 Tax=Linum trigynum TaxID=586398 RepID=A0AAV2ETF9_9ROSI
MIRLSDSKASSDQLPRKSDSSQHPFVSPTPSPPTSPVANPTTIVAATESTTFSTPGHTATTFLICLVLLPGEVCQAVSLRQSLLIQIQQTAESRSRY